MDSLYLDTKYIFFYTVIYYLSIKGINEFVEVAKYVEYTVMIKPL